MRRKEAFMKGLPRKPRLILFKSISTMRTGAEGTLNVKKLNALWIKELWRFFVSNRLFCRVFPAVWKTRGNRIFATRPKAGLPPGPLGLERQEPRMTKNIRADFRPTRPARVPCPNCGFAEPSLFEGRLAFLSGLALPSSAVLIRCDRCERQAGAFGPTLAEAQRAADSAFAASPAFAGRGGFRRAI